MNKRTVLLADDDPGLRRLVGATLGSEHFNLLSAGDGEETLSVARQRMPALILEDGEMIPGYQAPAQLLATLQAKDAKKDGAAAPAAAPAAAAPATAPPAG